MRAPREEVAETGAFTTFSQNFYCTGWLVHGSVFVKEASFWLQNKLL
jgi:hypothetical protein